MQLKNKKAVHYGIKSISFLGPKKNQKTVHYGIESLKFFGPKIRDLVHEKINNSQTLSELKCKIKL